MLQAFEVFQGAIIFIIPAAWPTGSVLNDKTTGLWDHLWVKAIYSTPLLRQRPQNGQLKSRAGCTLRGS